LRNPESGLASESPTRSDRHGWLPLAGSLVVIVIYFVLAKSGLVLASIHPSATPVWPPTGFAIAVLLLAGYRMTPPIFLGAFFANVTTAGNVTTSFAIAAGNSLECLLAAFLINRWSDGVRTFETPTTIARFALIAVAATVVSATVGVLSLTVAGFAPAEQFRAIWTTWWLGDVAGALMFTPLFLLWGLDRNQSGRAVARLEGAAAYAAAIVVALVAFSPLLPELKYRAALGFLALLPLLWTALRCNQRDTATVSVILSMVAVWGEKAGASPFSLADPNESFLLLLAFMISVSVPSLALSAAIATRDSTEGELRVSEARMREITARQSLLLAELSHRVNNILSVIQSIAMRTLSDNLSSEQTKKKLVGRLRALARAHELLVDTSWHGARLLDVVKSELEPYAEQVELRGQDVWLTTRAAQSFALLVHELTTNACKHGALSKSEGRVAVEWSVKRETESSCFHFRWKESHGPRVEEPERTGFGMSLLERAVDLEGGNKPVIAFDPAGFRFEVEVPAERILLA
jgi:two-component sensor histidine kinase/integral membrane sensor domain MASE1